MVVMFLAQPTTTTPSCASLFAISYPIPADAPVTIATLPFHLSIPALWRQVDERMCGNSDVMDRRVCKISTGDRLKYQQRFNNLDETEAKSHAFVIL